MEIVSNQSVNAALIKGSTIPILGPIAAVGRVALAIIQIVSNAFLFLLSLPFFICKHKFMGKCLLNIGKALAHIAYSPIEAVASLVYRAFQNLKDREIWPGGTYQYTMYGSMPWQYSVIATQSYSIFKSPTRYNQYNVG